MDWRDLLTAFALYLVLEGMMPFINPALYKRFMASMSTWAESSLRRVGAASMAAGLVFLYWVR